MRRLRRVQLRVRGMVAFDLADELVGLFERDSSVYVASHHPSGIALETVEIEYLWRGMFLVALPTLFAQARGENATS